MSKVNYILLLLTLFFSEAVYSKENIVKEQNASYPKGVVFQYAGNLGLFSAGVGKRIFSDKFFLGFMYGYLPKSKNDVEVHTLALKLGYVLREKSLSEKFKYALYCGTGITYSITKNTFVSPPDYFPDDYYKSNAFHFLPFAGINISTKLIDEKYEGIYFEVGTSDEFIYNNFINGSNDKSSLFNLAIGLIMGI